MGRLQPVQHRHSHIHQNDVWLELTSLVDRFGSIGGLAHNLQVWLGREYRSETLAHHRLIVDNQAARGHAVLPSGSTAATTNPPSSAGPAVKEPPRSPPARASR